MFISTNILLTRLSFLYTDIQIIHQKPLSLEPLKGIKLLPQNPEALSKEYLYVCDNVHPILDQPLPDDLKLVCITNTSQKPTNNRDAISLMTDTDSACILNDLQDIYQRLRDWEQELDIALITGCDLNYLLNISEKVLNFPLVIYDASLKVLAHSKGNGLNDELFQSVIEKGYFPPQMVFLFERDNIFTELEKTGILYGKYLSKMGYSDILLSLKVQNYTSAYMAMPCVPTESEIYGGELLQLLGTKVNHFLEKEQESSLTKRYMHEYLISDLFENENINISSLKERLEYIQVPFTGIFYLLQLKTTSKYKVSTEHLLRYLETLLSNAMIFTLEKDIYILFHYEEAQKESEVQSHFSQSLKSIRKDLQHENIICGISLPFYHLLDIRNARIQAETAVILYQQLHLPPEEDLYCYYSSCSINHLFLLAQEKTDLKAFCHSGLLAMYEKDLQTNGNHFHILKTYLECNSNISEAAGLLHMHRNNVIYHLKRMENLYHFDLENYKERFQLELTMQILTYLEASSAHTIDSPVIDSEKNS